MQTRSVRPCRESRQRSDSKLRCRQRGSAQAGHYDVECIEAVGKHSNTRSPFENGRSLVRPDTHRARPGYRFRGTDCTRLAAEQARSIVGRTAIAKKSKSEPVDLL